MWGVMQPGDDIRKWMKETIAVFRSHPIGIGKFASHYGTVPPECTLGTQPMSCFKVKVSRSQLTVTNSSTPIKGVVQDYYQFSYDHGNRMYADYMRLLFPADELKEVRNSDDPKEEVLGDCVEICLDIFRIALMYEECEAPLFKWDDINGALMGLETSLMTFNATAYASGVHNRRINSSRNKGRN